MMNRSPHLETLKQTLLSRAIVPFSLGKNISNSYIEQSLNDGLKVGYWVMKDLQREDNTCISTDINEVASFIVAVPQAYRTISKFKDFLSTMTQLIQDLDFKESLFYIFKRKLDEYISHSIGNGLIRNSMEVIFYNRISPQRPYVMPTTEPGDKFIMVEVKEGESHEVIELPDNTPPPITFNFRFFFCCHPSLCHLLHEVLTNIPTHNYTPLVKYYQFEIDPSVLADQGQGF